MEQQVRAVLRQAVDDVNSAPHLMPGIRLDVDLEFIPAHDSFAASKAGTLLALPALGLCGAGSTKRYGVRLSVCLSQHGPTAAIPLLVVCCRGPGEQEISIDCCRDVKLFLIIAKIINTEKNVS